jgi:DNA/RNA endonuclease G (NUC1)/V8-like Glu-specific endopeptidase
MAKATASEIIEKLNSAIQKLEREQVGELCRLIAAESVKSSAFLTTKQAEMVLGLLRRKRYFSEMRRLVEAFLRASLESAKLRCLYIQALVDSGELTAAMTIAEVWDEKLAPQGRAAEADLFEWSEIRGLIGRIHKQRFVECGRREWLQKAIEAYAAVYRTNPGKWIFQGINLVALLARAVRDRVAIDPRLDYRAIARDILQVVNAASARGPVDYWDLATAAEAAVALEKYDEALSWLKRYVRHPEVDAFELASPLRQFKEVWRLDPSKSPGNHLLPLLEASLLRKSGGSLTMDGAAEAMRNIRDLDRDGQLEKVFGLESYKTVEWYRKGLERSQAVALIENLGGQGVGTGFVVSGADLHSTLRSEKLLLTNSHVVSLRGEVANSLRPSEAYVRFQSPDGKGEGVKLRVREIIAQSPPAELDFALIRLDGPTPDFPVIPLAQERPRVSGEARLYAIGHPWGGKLSFSLHDNLFLDFVPPRLHYRTPTDRGSSGSPIFDDYWQLVALHHSGSKQMRRLSGDGGYYEANEGIWLESIRGYLVENPPSPNLSSPSEGRTTVSPSFTAAVEEPEAPLSRNVREVRETPESQAFGVTLQTNRSKSRSEAPSPRSIYRGVPMSAEKSQLLLSFAQRLISKDRGEVLRKQVLERPAFGASAMESVGMAGHAGPVATPELASQALEKLGLGQSLSQEEQYSLEAIVLPQERPVSFIENDTFAIPEHPWGHFHTDATIRGNLELAILSIGRVELPSSPNIPFGGTAFVVGPGLLMTNRHVAELFAQGLGRRELVFKSGQTAAWDFRRERNSPANDATTLKVDGVAMIHPYWDMALLRVSGLRPHQTPLRLSRVPPEELVGSEVAVIGYPAKDWRNDTELQDQIFSRTYNVKRLHPGKLNGRRTVDSYGKQVSALAHDSSTLGGNSGSAIVDARTGVVVGLHFAGRYLESNYAVPSQELSRDSRILDAGVTFVEGAAASPDPNVTARWNSLEPSATPTPPPAPSLPIAIVQPRQQHSSTLRLVVNGQTFTVPLQVSIDGANVRAESTSSVAAAGIEGLQQPIIFPRLDKRQGFDPDFLEFEKDAVKLPKLTEKGLKFAAKLDNGSHELKYHKFSVVVHKLRRLPLITAANVDFRDSVRKVNGRKPSRAELNGTGGSSEKWKTDDRIPENQQLPDVFYTKDGGAFDKGHIVRRDDVTWGESFRDMQMSNGDTFHTTNCTPQVSGFNQSAQGVDNWGDLESFIQGQAKAERLIVFAGPVLSPHDLRFEGVDERGELTIQIPTKFWKVVVAADEEGKPEAYGFVLEQNLSDVPLEFSVTPQWNRFVKRISEIEKLLFGLVSFEQLKAWDFRR